MMFEFIKENNSYVILVSDDISMPDAEEIITRALEIRSPPSQSVSQTDSHVVYQMTSYLIARCSGSDLECYIELTKETKVPRASPGGNFYPEAEVEKPKIKLTAVHDPSNNVTTYMTATHHATNHITTYAPVGTPSIGHR